MGKKNSKTPAPEVTETEFENAGNVSGWEITETESGVESGASAAGTMGTGSGKDIDLPDKEIIEAELKRAQYRSTYTKAFRSTIYALIIVAAITVIIAVLLLPVLQITGTSMTETLQNGDIVVALNGSKYKTGDVVAFYYNNSILVKRVIASSGDWINIDEDGNVTVNDKLLDEPYVSEKAMGYCDITLPYQVPDGKNFLMGDHRETSMDSRNSEIGCISDDMVVGKIIFCVWPFSDFGRVK